MKNKTRFVHLATRVFDTPLMIHRGKLDIILNVLGPRFELDAQAVPMAHEEIISGGVDPEPIESAGNLAIIPIHGTLVQRAMGLDALSGLTSYELISDQLDAALEDPEVAAIVLDVDSPGGEANGCFDLADKIYEARKVKPIYGIANEFAFSAAYALLSACSKIYLPRTGNVGSIGVIATHIDQSQRDTREGFKVTHVTAGEYKADFSPHKPLSEGALGRLQEDVNELYDIFAETVARNRGIDVKAVKDTKAGLYLGKAAVKAGLADAVMSTTDAMKSIEEEVNAMETKGENGGELDTATSQSSDKTQAAAGAPAAEATTEAPAATTTAPAPAPAPAPAATTAAKEEQPNANAESEVAKERARSAAITEMCANAGCPDKAVELINSGMSVEACKAKMFDALAGGEVTLNAVNPTKKGAEAEGEDILVAAMRAHNDKSAR